MEVVTKKECLLGDPVVQTSLRHLKTAISVAALKRESTEKCWDQIPEVTFSDALKSPASNISLYDSVLKGINISQYRKELTDTIIDSQEGMLGYKSAFGSDLSLSAALMSENNDYRDDNTTLDWNCSCYFPYLDGSLVEIENARALLVHAPEGKRAQTAFFLSASRLKVQTICCLVEPATEAYNPVLGSSVYWPESQPDPSLASQQSTGNTFTSPSYVESSLSLVANTTVSSTSPKHLQLPNSLEYLTRRKLIFCDQMRSHAFEHFHWRCMEDHSTSDAQNMNFLVDQILAIELDEQRPILIHCHGGVGRSGLLLMLLAIKRAALKMAAIMQSETTDQLWARMQLMIRDNIVRLRLQRPGALQSSIQLGMVYHYAALSVLWLVCDNKQTRERIYVMSKPIDETIETEWIEGQKLFAKAVVQSLTDPRRCVGWLKSTKEKKTMQHQLNQLIGLFPELYRTWSDSILMEIVQRYLIQEPLTDAILKQQIPMFCGRLCKSNRSVTQFILTLLNTRTSFSQLNRIISLNVTSSDRRSLWQLILSGEFNLLNSNLEQLLRNQQSDGGDSSVDGSLFKLHPDAQPENVVQWDVVNSLWSLFTDPTTTDSILRPEYEERLASQGIQSKQSLFAFLWE
eukprot:TRINITY_DN6107_c0_g2_i1.p1 TRINITY_DN6107_c0_g2~~TRINITY_DN6107_c0_g2_i1.p1  ORF type:complete len:661 (-),score=95.20 TRINITY_DN6107_c0_g2_i1:106-1995(-)